MKFFAYFGKKIYHLIIQPINAVKYHKPHKSYRYYKLNSLLYGKTQDNSIFSWNYSAASNRVRIIILFSGFILCFVVLVYRLLLITHEGYTLKPKIFSDWHFRNEIIDRHGTLLAVNLPTFSLYANPQKVVNPELYINKLGSVLPDLDKNKLISELKSNKKFIWIKQDLSPEQKTKIFNLGLPGFDFIKEQKRFYPFTNLLAHIIGYVGRDMKGLAGIEKNYDNFLRQANENNSPNLLQLSIDAKLQTIVNEELEEAISTFKAKGATAIIADPNNGEILSVVSKPDFNPHNLSQANHAELFNTASLGVYEIGSVFKTLTLAMGFDSHKITLNDLYDLSYMRVGKFEVKDFRPMRGWHSVPEIFLHSSNIGVSQIMLEVGKDTLYDYLKNLGLLSKLQLELPECAVPLYPNKNKLQDLSLVTMSYGYGLSISPLHLMQALIPTVNGGKFYPLTLIKNKNDDIEPRQVFSTETSENMQKLLRLVVKKGTGKKAEVEGYLVGGKTGTAYKATGKKYDKNSRISSFFAVVPATAPQYVIYVMLDDPKGTKDTFGFASAGWNAAPTARKIITRMVGLYGLQKNEEDPELEQFFEVDYLPSNAT